MSGLDDRVKGVIGERKYRLAALAALVLLALGTFRLSFVQMWRAWDVDPTFTHGFLIGPIVAWLLWHERTRLAQVPLNDNLLGLLGLVLACGAWAVAVVLDVRVVAQVAVVAAMLCLVLAMLGWSFVRAAAFPLAFLFFLVPFGKDLVPPLMRITADLSVFLLNLTGIPVLREGMLLHIPAGSYEVARACSGIRYLMTAAVIGTLYAYLMYATWRKRVIAVAVALAVAVLANGVRAYGLVVIGHVTDMRFDHDGWHVALGQVLFAVVMLLMFVIGRRFRDPESAFRQVDWPPTAAADSMPASRLWMTVAACVVVLLVAGRAAHPELLATAESEPLPEIGLPTGAGGWAGPEEASGKWRPDYRKPLSIVEGTYGKGETAVDVYVAAYRAPPGQGGELVSHHNQLDPEMTERQFRERDLEIATSEGRGVAREVWIDRGARRLVAYWFVVNGEPTTNRYHVKWLELKALLSGRLADERIVVVSVDGDRGEALEDFLTSHGASLGLTGPGTGGE